jgi:hypothetical protein
MLLRLDANVGRSHCCFRVGPKAVLGQGKACFAADLGFKEIRVDARAGDVMAARGRGVLLVLRLVTNLPSQVKQYTYTVTTL